ncbi:MAG TPA: sigma-70 family RNA polymerase sigma factor [Polyangiales bacterium]|jgi:RNA polymerase sigma-70 factor (ECF subfamily)|nr:sigma-70 family RNA polymerase sigma factor [Polyangiales bacterium]
MPVSDTMGWPDQNSKGQPTTEESVVDDEALVDSLILGEPEARAWFFDAYGRYVERLLVRVLGPDPEVEDLLHDVFAEALGNVHKLRDPARLKAWLTRMTVFIARGRLRRRRRQSWLSFLPEEELPASASPSTPPEARDLLQRVFAVLQRLHPNQRIAFSLRYIEGMTLPEAAEASGVSLATFKRRLKAADRAFMERAQRADEALYEQLLETPRWGVQP